MTHPNVDLVRATYRRLTGTDPDGKLLSEIELTVLPELVRMEVRKQMRGVNVTLTAALGDIEDIDNW